MARFTFLCALLVAGSLTSGCSTRPRNFTANLTAPVAERSVFESNFRTCQALVRQGHTSNFKGAAATALATGVGTVGAGAAIAGTGLVGITTTGGGAAAASLAMPIVGVLIGFGISRAIRGGREGRFKRAMDSCLNEYGYSVRSWTKLHKNDDAARVAAQLATVHGTGPETKREAPVVVAGISAQNTGSTDVAEVNGSN